METVAFPAAIIFWISSFDRKAQPVFCLSLYYFRQCLVGGSHGENYAGGFGTEHQSVSRLNLLQMLFSTHHAGSKLQTDSSAQT